jgi:hypothetical protein
MTWRSDSSQLFAGKWTSSLYAGLGIQAQNIPSTGTSGAGYLFNDIAAQGMAATDEVRGEILTWPSAGTLTVNEDSSFSFSAPDGVYNFGYRGCRNGASYGDYTVALTIGGESVTATITGGLPVPACSASASNSAPVSSATISAGLPIPSAAVNAVNAGSNNVATIAAGLPVPMAAVVASISGVNSAAVTAGLPVPVASVAVSLTLPIYQATVSAGLPVPAAIAVALTGERQIFISADRMAILPSYSRHVAL